MRLFRSTQSSFQHPRISSGAESSLFGQLQNVWTPVPRLSLSPQALSEEPAGTGLTGVTGFANPSNLVFLQLLLTRIDPGHNLCFPRMPPFNAHQTG